MRGRTLPLFCSLLAAYPAGALGAQLSFSEKPPIIEQLLGNDKAKDMLLTYQTLDKACDMKGLASAIRPKVLDATMSAVTAGDPDLTRPDIQDIADTLNAFATGYAVGLKRGMDIIESHFPGSRSEMCASYVKKANALLSK